MVAPLSDDNVVLEHGEADWVPPSGTLPTADQPSRVAESDDLFASAVRGVDRLDPLSGIDRPHRGVGKRWSIDTH